MDLLLSRVAPSIDALNLQICTETGAIEPPMNRIRLIVLQIFDKND